MTEPGPVTCSVVICCYTERRLDLLLEAARAVAGQLGDGDELLVVVDHNANLQAMLADRVPPAARLVASTGPAGLSGGRNTGVALATGDVVVFLDDDAVPAADWLAQLRAPYADPAVVGVGGRADPAWESARPAWWPAEFDWVVGCHYTGLPEQVGPVRNLMGCTMSLRRSVIELVGGFRDGVGRGAEGLPMGCEETELCIRVAQALPASRLVLEPAARVAHHVGADRAQAGYFLRRCYAEGLSKAAVTSLVGSSDGLSTERAYVRTVLPAAVLRGLAELTAGRPAGAARSGAVLAGLATTGAGYARGRRWGRRRHRSQSAVTR